MRLMSKIEIEILKNVLIIGRDYLRNTTSDASVAIPFTEESFRILEVIWQKGMDQPNDLTPEICEDYDGDGDGERRMYIDFVELADYFIEQLANT